MISGPHRNSRALEVLDVLILMACFIGFAVWTCTR